MDIKVKYFINHNPGVYTYTSNTIKYCKTLKEFKNPNSPSNESCYWDKNLPEYRLLQCVTQEITEKEAIKRIKNLEHPKVPKWKAIWKDQ